MKLYAKLLALSAIAGSSAFVVQPSTFVKSTSLYADADASLAVAEEAPSAVQSSADLFSTLETIRVQGDTLKTCSFEEGVERVEVLMKSGSRPVHADVELWQGHTNDPQRMKVYLEDGSERTFRAVVECPGSSNSVSIRNTATQEYPLSAGVMADYGGPESAGSPAEILSTMSDPRIVQGGAVYILPFAPEVQSIQVMLRSDGRPMSAKLELLQGPNNVKQSMEVYSEAGNARALYTILDSPGTGNVVRIVNTATVEYPLEAFIEPYIVDESLIEDATGTMWR